MKKSELKNGMMLVLNNGNKRILIDGKLYDEKFGVVNSLDQYNDNLEYVSYGERPNLNIDEIYDNRKIIWKRGKYAELSEEEYAALKLVPKKYKYIARDENDDLYLYTNKPIKIGIFKKWGSTSECMTFFTFSHLFKFIRFDDDEPYTIADLLKVDKQLEISNILKELKCTMSSNTLCHATYYTLHTYSHPEEEYIVFSLGVGIIHLDNECNLSFKDMELILKLQEILRNEM